MSDTYPLQRAFICFFGTTALYRRAAMLDILARFETISKFTPTQWGLDESAIRHDYQPNELLARLDSNTPLDHNLYIKRTKAVKYQCTFSLGERASLFIEVDKKISGTNWARVFELADNLAEVFQPDVGTVYFSPVFNVHGTDQRDIDLKLILAAAYLYPAEYYQVGPKGLGMRTYIGSHFRAASASGVYDELPAEVSALDWGGIRVDLFPELIPENEASLISAWQANMAVLWSDQVFASCEIRDQTKFYFSRGKQCVVR